MIVSSSEKSDEIEKKVIQQLHIYYGEVWFKRMEAEWKLSTVTGTGLVHMVVHTSGSWDILDPLCFNSPPPPSPWNQHPPVHQLAVLSIRWAAFLHPVSDPVLTNILPQSTSFGCSSLTLLPPFCFWVFFLNPAHTTLQPSYIIDLHVGLTYQPPNYLPSIFSWLNLYLLAKNLSFPS